MFERVLLARRCRRRAAEWKGLAETAITDQERFYHFKISEHYSTLAEAVERSVKAELERRFPHMKPVNSSGPPAP